MGPLVTFIFVLGPAVLATYTIIWRVRLNRRNLDKAIAYVVQALNSPRNDSVSEVILGHASPLSDHMVKDVADTRGYRVLKEGSRHSNTILQFTPREGKRRKLSLDD